MRGQKDHRSHPPGFPTRGAARWVQSQGGHASGPQFPQEEVGMGFLPPYGWLPHPSTPALGWGEDAGRDSGGIERGTYRLRRAQAARPGSPGGPWASGSGGAREEGRGEPGSAPPTRPPRARPGRGPEGRWRRAPPRGRSAPGHGSAAGDCPARAAPRPPPRDCGLVSDRPGPGDLGKPREGEPRGN